MSVITRYGHCRRCKKSGAFCPPIYDNDPYCTVCMEELEKEAWDYKPNGYDSKLWEKTIKELKDL